MPGGIPDEIQQFIFEYVDSVEQLEILLLLRSRPDREWTAQEISDELRTNPVSAATRLLDLKGIGVIADNGASPPSYRYRPVTPEMACIMDGLAEACKIRRHKVYELIFSSLKRARKLLDAFTLREKKGDPDV